MAHMALVASAAYSRSHIATASTTMRNSAPSTINPIIAPIIRVLLLALLQRMSIYTSCCLTREKLSLRNNDS